MLLQLSAVTVRWRSFVKKKKKKESSAALSFPYWSSCITIYNSELKVQEHADSPLSDDGCLSFSYLLYLAECTTTASCSYPRFDLIDWFLSSKSKPNIFLHPALTHIPFEHSTLAPIYNKYMLRDCSLSLYSDSGNQNPAVIVLA